VFTNPNRCHALTFMFYKLNKCQTLKWELIGITRRVDDPAAPTGITLNDPPPFGGVTVIPDGVLATSAQRLDAESRARSSVAEAAASPTLVSRSAFLNATAVAANAQALAAAVRQAALTAVDEELVKEGLIDKVGGDVSSAAQRLFGWERQIALPTAGIIVKGCLDECDVCEPSLDKEIELELEHRRLENELLKKQIALLEKSQEYRCCPPADDDDDDGS